VGWCGVDGRRRGIILVNIVVGWVDVGRYHPRRDLLERWGPRPRPAVCIVVSVLLLLKVDLLDPASAGIFIDRFEYGERGREAWRREGVVEDRRRLGRGLWSGGGSRRWRGVEFGKEERSSLSWRGVNEIHRCTDRKKKIERTLFVFLSVHSKLLAETARCVSCSSCLEQLLEALALETDAARVIGGLLPALELEMMYSRRGSQENRPEGIIVIVNGGLGEEGEGGIRLDSGFLRGSRGDGNHRDLEIHGDKKRPAPKRKRKGICSGIKNEIQIYVRRICRVADHL
jgi:hypothetical protein